MTKKQVTRWLIKYVKDGQLIDSRQTAKYTTIRKNLQAQMIQPGVSVELRADYGKHKDNFGDMVTFENEGIYTNYKDTLIAMEAFQEVALEWEKEAK